VQPQVEGYLTRIDVKSGDRVGTGAALMEIDSRSQQAAIASLESVRTQRQVDLTYAQQEADRAAKLLAAGAASQMDFDKATNAVKAAQAQLRTVDEQIRQLRTDFAYYHVTAPTGGLSKTMRSKRPGLFIASSTSQGAFVAARINMPALSAPIASSSDQSNWPGDVSTVSHRTCCVNHPKPACLTSPVVIVFPSWLKPTISTFMP